MALEQEDLPAHREGSCVDRLKRLTSSSRAMEKGMGNLFDWSHLAWGLPAGQELKLKIETVERKLAEAEEQLPGLSKSHSEFSKNASEANEHLQAAFAELQRFPPNLFPFVDPMLRRMQ